jgi:hypothetical protein
METEEDMSTEEIKPRQRASIAERENPTPPTQEVPAAEDSATAPRPQDDRGYQLDEHGLPLVGPARARALNGRPDPALSA